MVKTSPGARGRAEVDVIDLRRPGSHEETEGQMLECAHGHVSHPTEVCVRDPPDHVHGQHPDAYLCS